MARDFKMHRAGPPPPRSGPGIIPLGGRSNRAAGRAQLAGRGAPRAPEKGASSQTAPVAEVAEVAEIGGPEGPEPTRYGDWERNGICYDF
jgi:hypothetical protein